MSATWYRPKPKDFTPRRRALRKSARLPVILRSIDGLFIGNCLMIDVSEGGARLTFDRTGHIPQSFDLLLSADGRASRRCLTRWRTETEIGVQFVKG
jgi:hypothetical protein